MSDNIQEIEIDVAVVGGGPAGMAAALEANKIGANVIIIERDNELGGILQQCIHNGFGLKHFKEELTGPEYAQRFINEIKKSNIDVWLRTMVINITPTRFLTVINPKRGLIHLKAKSIILAMGCRERTRGAINIPGMRPAGIYPAGQAQRFINMEGYLPGNRVVILGSGDIGMIMARRCTLEGMKVLAVAEVLPYPSGLVRNRVQCLDDYNIPLYLRHTIIDIRGKERVEGVTIAQIDEKWRPIPGTEKYYDCDTILFSVGLIPENELTSQAGAVISSNGGPEIDEFLQTTIPGIFACGNVLQVHDLVDWVTEEAQFVGKNAGLFALDKFPGRKKLKKPICVVPGENVGYVKPERIEYRDEISNITISFRVKNPRSNIRTILTSNGKEIYTKRHRFVLPSEMIHLTPKLKLELIEDEIQINVVEKDQTVNIIEKELMEEK
ncbi:MAG: pyridine nucleotide-disulfide oxidoreductase [Promethearchaeia archaeon]|nr:MAG: pyridine nucleotide-disulfide oxidoreductase [Candidatus Lokiarchaeia archaeon]